MGQRLDLHKILVDILGSDQVYYQPPATVQMKYPAIVYSPENGHLLQADDSKYRHVRRYQVSVIDRNPDSDIPAKVFALPYASESRTFAVANLNHFVFTLYF